MDEKKFITILKRNLEGLSREDKIEIISDYKEHFRIGRESGKSEEEISLSLGDPRDIGKANSMELSISERETEGGYAFKAVIASISLIMFNLIFVVGPYFGIVATIISLWASAFAIAVSGLATILAILFRPLLELLVPYAGFSLGFGGNLAMLFGGILILSLGILSGIGLKHLSKAFIRVSIKYLNSNLKIILRR